MSDQEWRCRLCGWTTTHYVIAGQGLPYSGEVPWLLRQQVHMLGHIMDGIIDLEAVLESTQERGTKAAS